MEIEPESTARMTWDQGRQLADDMCNFSPPDLEGAVLLLHAMINNDELLLNEKPLFETLEYLSDILANCKVR